MILSIGIFVAFLSGEILAQGFTFGVGGGISQALSPESYTNKISEGGFGFSTEWNAGATAKLSLPLLPIKPRAILLYHSLSGSENLEPGGKKEYSQSIVTAGAGIQYNFIPVPLGADPYIYLDLLYNNFGKLEIDPEPVGYTSSSESRFGVGIGVGTSVPLIPVLNLDVQLAYQIMNIVGKDDGEDSIGFLAVDLFVMFGSN